ncbi:MAG: tRNA (N(6)-L-threonylcarbamoyladenosine(37)-C(2))-methylthiotransferase MtaB, partial [Pseudomonadota bacterium]
RVLSQMAALHALERQVVARLQTQMERERLGRTETFAEVSFETPKPVGAILSTTMSGVDGKRLAA